MNMLTAAGSTAIASAATSAATSASPSADASSASASGVATITLLAPLLPPERRHRPNALRSQNGSTRFLSPKEYDSKRRLARSQVPGAVFSPHFPGFKPETWGNGAEGHTVLTPQSQNDCKQPVHRDVSIICAKSGGAIEADDSPTSEVRVIYPKKRNKSVITQVKKLHDAHNETREMDLMEGGMVGAGTCIVRACALLSHPPPLFTPFLHALTGTQGGSH